MLWTVNDTIYVELSWKYKNKKRVDFWPSLIRPKIAKIRWLMANTEILVKNNYTISFNIMYVINSLECQAIGIKSVKYEWEYLNQVVSLSVIYPV